MTFTSCVYNGDEPLNKLEEVIEALQTLILNEWKDRLNYQMCEAIGSQTPFSAVSEANSAKSLAFRPRIRSTSLVTT